MERPNRGYSPAGLHCVLLVLALSGLVLISYGNSIANGFVWDDHEQIEKNPALRAETPLADLFTSDLRFANRSSSISHTDYYRPLQLLTYRAVMTFSGGSPAAFHISSIALFMGGTLLGFGTFWLLTREVVPAFVAAALFAVYPVHTEAVDWIAASPDLGCGLFVLLAFVLFLRFHSAIHRLGGHERSAFFRRLIPVLSLLAFAAALLWKETAAVFPLLVVAYVLIVESGDGNRISSALKASAPYWVVFAVYLVLRVRALGSLGTGRRNWDLTPAQLLLSAMHLMVSYWEKLALPFRLNAYYIFSPVRSAFEPRAVAAMVFAACAIAGLIYLVRRAPLCAFAVLWVFITLLPAMDLSAVGRNAFAERYLYLPSIGFCLLVGLALSRLMSWIPSDFRKAAGVSLVVIAIAGFGAETIGRNPDWKDDRTLFLKTLQVSPDAPFVRYMVASAQSANPSEFESAERNYQQAIALAKQEFPPDRLDWVMASEGLAWLYADRSDYERALEAVSEAKEVARADTGLDEEEGVILARAGRWGEAEPLLEKSFASQPQDVNVLAALGLMAWQYRHDLNQAKELFSRALSVHAQEDDIGASLHSNLGAVCGERGDFSSAIEQFRLAIGISPRNPEYHANLANALGAAKRYDEARLEAEAALRIEPGYPAALEVLRNIGVR